MNIMILFRVIHLFKLHGLHGVPQQHGRIVDQDGHKHPQVGQFGQRGRPIRIPNNMANLNQDIV